jgi:hypothetical protein
VNEKGAGVRLILQTFLELERAIWACEVLRRKKCDEKRGLLNSTVHFNSGRVSCIETTDVDECAWKHSSYFSHKLHDGTRFFHFHFHYFTFRVFLLMLRAPLALPLEEIGNSATQAFRSRCDGLINDDFSLDVIPGITQEKSLPGRPTLEQQLQEIAIANDVANVQREEGNQSATKSER